MKKIFSFLFFTAILSSILISHELWMFSSNYHPEVNREVKLFVCSGHNFPKSNFLIKKNLIKEIYVKTPATKSDLTFSNNKRVWESQFSPKKSIIYISVFSLVKKKNSEPFFWGRAIIETKGSDNVKFDYLTGEGLEIVPLDKISTVIPGGQLQLQTLFKGKVVKFSGKISLNGGKNIFLNSDKSGIVKIKKVKTGTYLVTARYKDKGCSLTFDLK